MELPSDVKILKALRRESKFYRLPGLTSIIDAIIHVNAALLSPLAWTVAQVKNEETEEETCPKTTAQSVGESTDAQDPSMQPAQPHSTGEIIPVEDITDTAIQEPLTNEAALKETSHTPEIPSKQPLHWSELSGVKDPVHPEEITDHLIEGRHLDRGNADYWIEDLQGDSGVGKCVVPPLIPTRGRSSDDCFLDRC